MTRDFEVVVGEHEITSSEDGTRHEVCGVTSHPRYATHGDNDYAIVRLKEPVEIGARAVPACLPDASWGIDSGFLDDKTMTVSGWGRTSSGGSQANALLKVDVPGISNAVCKTKYSPSQINESMMCAGREAGGIDSCQGDSGGMYIFHVLMLHTLSRFTTCFLNTCYHFSILHRSVDVHHRNSCYNLRCWSCVLGQRMCTS